ncbi:hypothetical protein JFN88_04105 [Paenibacillus sp. MAHUQ-46]|uniref:Uncharacterized protein n=2 Tax=Paenibacillus TaxID=44249 RepID=A0A934MTX4_9BACL|nr:hypothetical protein [Paenibacillus roseus]MBJ6360507.1 hypothetical protein [Paenibacillus roseus]
MNFIKKMIWNRTTYFTALFLLLVIAVSPVAFASTPGGDPVVVTGSKRLGQDFLKWVLILVPITAASMMGYQAWMKGLADGDENAIAMRNKAMKRILISTIIAFSAVGIVQLVISYYS